MKKFVFVLALSMVVSGLSMASEPEITLPGPGGSPMGIDRTVLWLDTPDCLAAIASSEVIGAFALESEIANDFMLEEAATIEKVTWWGGYWNYDDHTQFPTGSGFNLRYYYDAGCLPEVTPFLEFLLPGDDCCETLTDCPEDDDHIFVYEYCHSLPLEPGLYWFSAQMADHPFPPQWGRLSTGIVQICESTFRSEYFAYPEWTPASAVFGYLYDASQMFEDECIPTATEDASWGAIKGLYR